MSGVQGLLGRIVKEKNIKASRLERKKYSVFNYR